MAESLNFTSYCDGGGSGGSVSESNWLKVETTISVRNVQVLESSASRPGLLAEHSDDFR
jgi:hypothetical protein